jgi:transglutaminase-like putative cysteine protease
MVISEAQSITSGENNTHEKVFKICNFVIRHMQYKTQDEERGALWALENGIGDCSEYTYLFVALCRAQESRRKLRLALPFTIPVKL